MNARRKREVVLIALTVLFAVGCIVLATISNRGEAKFIREFNKGDYAAAGRQNDSMNREMLVAVASGIVAFGCLFGAILTEAQEIKARKRTLKRAERSEAEEESASAF